MPKKTKKAKLIAEYRRKLQHLEGTSIPVSSTSAHEVFTLPVVTPNLPKSSVMEMPQDESLAIRKDLIKTVITVSLFLIFEFFLARIIQ
ncbi:MAG: hypothetical protein WAV51_03530 [Microgenomates group bacterium]